MDTPADIFNGYRPRLFGIAYRMLGSRAAGRFLRSGPWSLRLLSYTFHMLISEQHRGERPSRVTFELQPPGLGGQAHFDPLRLRIGESNPRDDTSWLAGHHVEPQEPARDRQPAALSGLGFRPAY